MRKGAGWAATDALVVALAGCGGESDPSAEPGAAGPEKDTVVVKDIAFKPDRIRVAPGTTVTWRFEDKGIPHDVKAKDESFQSEIMDDGVFRHTFDEPGTYEYLCSVHPAQMKAVVEVG